MGHCCLRIFLILITFVVMACNIAISYLASSDIGIESGLYLNETGDISDRFYLLITPANWTFIIWAVIFTYQVVWMFYILTSICRRVPDDSGRHVYQLPLHPPVFFILYILVSGATLAWSFLFDRQWIGGSLIDIVFIPLMLSACLAISVVRVYQNIPFLKSVGLNKDIWLSRLLVQNGLAIFLTWVSIATILNFTMVLTYVWNVTMETACLIGLAILSLEILIWVSLDTFVLDKYVRYIFTPHCVLVFALSGSFTQNYNIETNYKVSIYLAVLLGVTVFALVEKIFLMIWRHCRQPIKGTITDDIKGNLA